MGAIHPNFTVGGIDISYHQGAMNWSQTASMAQFAIIRVGDGGVPGMRDPLFRANWSGAKLEGVPRGSYWFFRPESNGRTQAESLWEALRDDQGELPAFLDLELNSRRLSMDAVTRAVVDFVNLADQKLQKPVGFYTSKGFWDSYVNPDLIPNLAERALWAAQWPTSVTPAPTAIPHGWPRWDLWQFSARGSGAMLGSSSKSVDLNVWRGAYDEFARFFNLPPKPPEPGMPRAFKTLGSLKAMSRPTLTAPVVAELQPGTVWPVAELADDEQGKLWGLIARFDSNEAWAPLWSAEIIT